MNLVFLKKINKFTQIFILILIFTGTIITFALLYNTSSTDTKFSILFEGDENLFNPYGVLLVNPDKHPDVKMQESAEFVKWLISPKGQNLIREYEIYNQTLFTPNFNQSALSYSEKSFWDTIEVGKTSSVIRIRLATTTSARDSGLLDYLLPKFYEDSKVRVDIIAVGTGAALETARQGNVDLVMVHARNLENQFIADGHGIYRIDLMYNDFVLIGPNNDPAGVMKATNIDDAFYRIYLSKSKFISRGDNSGTHVKELSLWQKLNISIESDKLEWADKNPWYIESGSGMSETIFVAFELHGYTISDRATWINISINSDLT